MTTSYFASRPLATHLHNDFLLEQGFPLLYGGAYWKLRFCILVKGTNVGADLTNALAIFKLVYGAAALTRKTGVTSSGAPTAQIVLDDQTEGGEAGDLTGKGWLTVYCYAVAAEVAEFAPFFVGLGEEGFVRGTYELAVKFADAVTQHPVFGGCIDINKPKNTFPLS